MCVCAEGVGAHGVGAELDGELTNVKLAQHGVVLLRLHQILHRFAPVDELPARPTGPAPKRSVRPTACRRRNERKRTTSSSARRAHGNRIGRSVDVRANGQAHLSTLGRTPCSRLLSGRSYASVDSSAPPSRTPLTTVVKQMLYSCTHVAECNATVVAMPCRIRARADLQMLCCRVVPAESDRAPSTSFPAPHSRVGLPTVEAPG